METSLNYNFKRQSKNHLDWLINFIKSDRSFEIKAILLNKNNPLFIE
jgi:hypothetical protein